MGNNGIVPGATYEMFSVSGTAPAGAVAARFVYAVQTFGSEQDGGATNSGFINVDDISVTIPEPSAATLFGLGLVGLLLRRKR